MVKGVATSIITVAVLMGSLVACSGSDSELAELREELENVKEQLEDSLEPEETSEQVLVESEQQLEIEKSANASTTSTPEAIVESVPNEVPTNSTPEAIVESVPIEVELPICEISTDDSIPIEEQKFDELYDRYHCFLDQLLAISESEELPPMEVSELKELLGWPEDTCKTPTVAIEKSPYQTTPSGNIFTIDGEVQCETGLLIPISGLLGVPLVSVSSGFLVTVPGSASSPERIFGLEIATYDAIDYAHGFARRAMEDGFVVFSPRVLDDILLDPVSAYNSRRGEIDRRAQVLGNRLHGIELLALSNTITELQKNPEIAGLKTGVYGISLGGSIAFWLGAVNQDIDAVVSSQWVEERTDKLAGRNNPWSMWRFEYGDYTILSDAAIRLKDERVAQLIHPRPLLLEYGDQDVRAVDVLPVWEELIDLYPPGSEDEGRLSLVIEPGGHEIFYDKAIDFLKLWLSSD